MSIKKPADIGRLTTRVVSAIFREGSEIQNAGKLSQLFLTWLKAREATLKEEEIKQLQEAVKRLQDEVDHRRDR